jgi:hypothetical protein
VPRAEVKFQHRGLRRLARLQAQLQMESMWWKLPQFDSDEGKLTSFCCLRLNIVN